MRSPNLSSRKWFYPLIYFLLIIISFLPVVTQVPLDPRNTQDVIQNILMVSINPYQAWGWVFHVATLGLVFLIAFKPNIAGRVLALYMGVNYLVIGALQTSAFTKKYGFALQTGLLVVCVLLSLIWLVVAYQDRLKASFKDVPAWRYLLVFLALLVFWSPFRAEGMVILPDFSPLKLLTDAGYGMTYCFTTPVFLFLLILFYANVDGFAFRVTAFNGLIYGLVNLIWWFNPATLWMGVLHLPLLLLSILALLMPVFRRKAQQAEPIPVETSQRPSDKLLPLLVIAILLLELAMLGGWFAYRIRIGASPYQVTAVQPSKASFEPVISSNPPPGDFTQIVY